MHQILNTSEIKYGDIILGLPGKLDYGAFLKCSNKSNINLNTEDNCFDIRILPEDIESFGEECYIAKCIMIDNNRLHFVELKSGDTFGWDSDIEFCIPGYTMWKLDIKI